jgi:predicted small metal-binding protein
VAYSIRCADSGADCPGVFTTDTEDELMQHVQMHASVAHPEMTLTPETLEQIKGLVQTVWPCLNAPASRRLGLAHPVIRVAAVVGNRASTRFRSSALVATMRELADVNNTDHCGPRMKPVARNSASVAIGIAGRS